MKNRVKIPANSPLQLIALLKRIDSKHRADGNASFLKELNMDDATSIADEALQHHNDAERKRREMSDLYQLRAKKIALVLEAVRDSRDILRRKHKNQVKALGHWGFDVLDPQTMSTQVLSESSTTTQS